MKISIIGAGNVGGLAALRIAQEGLGTVVLVDVVRGIACGKAFDCNDAQGLLKRDYSIMGTDDTAAISGSGVVVVTAGLPRKPGETREYLLKKNAEILKSVSNAITQHAPGAVVIVVTNPLDVMTLYLLEATGFQRNRVFGMGITLDASRFANLISEELKVPVSSISPCVIGSHGEGMMPLARLTSVKGVAVNEIMDDKKISVLVERTVDRGKEIVGLFGSGSAFAAPSAAIAELVKAVIKDEKRTLGVSAYLTGQYGIRDICIGVPCCIGKNGIESIVELDLNDQEKAELVRAASKIQEQVRTII